MSFTMSNDYYIMEPLGFQGKRGQKSMKAAGIVAEYDPFHAGHAWQIARARELGAQAVAVCMSADVTQRGGAALLPPAVRAR
ncbi:nucleotidyltransferase family protein, partial [Allofournierella sp.]|uniref:nucleotidyltransferase family protein n=1 Tax=Allofournierella sp. TaxID=1940256 RepID=UPI003AEF5AAB